MPQASPAARAAAQPSRASTPVATHSPTQSLPEQIAACLAERITNGAYPPTQRIMEQAIAAEFEVSRGPVRDALRLLEKDGLVTILPRRGAQVTRLSVDEVRELFDIRALLNGLRDRQIAESSERLRILPALEAEVKKLARFAREAALGEAYVDTIARIDQLLTHAAGSRYLQTIQASLVRQTQRYRLLGLSALKRRRQSAQNWQNLVQAIRRGDGARAEQLARQRVNESRDAAIALLAERAPPPVRAAARKR
ncbi:MAG: GntR family transcriptional regulator [Proteobacteria bacterium]|nr:GntR family transcriptional regulator [Burkholderiales bacterium]